MMATSQPLYPSSHFLASPKTILNPPTVSFWEVMSTKLSAQLLGELQAQAGSDFEVLADQESPRFLEFAKRWTDIDRQIPAAITLPTSEEQIQKTVPVPDTTAMSAH
jgi:hypothetical protein